MPVPPKPKKAYTIGVALPHLANPHFVAQAYGYYDEAQKLGAKVVILEAGGYANLDRQISQVEDLLARPVDAIILVAVNLEGTRAVVDECNQRGVPVINVNVMTANENVVTRIRSDDVTIGKKLGEYLVKAKNGKANVLMLSGAPGASYAIYRPQGFKEYVASYPGIKILDERFQQNNPESGVKEMEDALQKFPEMDTLYTSGEMLALGAANAIQAAGKTGQITILTVDPSVDTIQAIKDGRIAATVVQSSVDMGRWGIRAAIWTLEGKADQLVKQYYTPLYVVDKTNADTFQFEGVSRPPAGWTMPTS
jgi:ABC-type sugar transport system substrate-binding protein